jgi:hypothetical protein
MKPALARFFRFGPGKNDPPLSASAFAVEFDFVIGPRRRKSRSLVVIAVARRDRCRSS